MTIALRMGKAKAKRKTTINWTDWPEKMNERIWCPMLSASMKAVFICLLRSLSIRNSMLRCTYTRPLRHIHPVLSLALFEIGYRFAPRRPGIGTRPPHHIPTTPCPYAPAAPLRGLLTKSLGESIHSTPVPMNRTIRVLVILILVLKQRKLKYSDYCSRKTKAGESTKRWILVGIRAGRVLWPGRWPECGCGRRA